MRSLTLIASMLLFWCTGCQQEPIAKFSITAVSVGDWDNYRDRLQPKFLANPEAMLAKVLPITQRSQLSVVDQFSGRLSVQIPAGDSTAETPTVPAAPAASSLPGIQALGSLDNDPLLQYHLANALYQEVQLLNGALRDAAIPSQYRAYVVRLNLGVISFRSNQEADLYATISFFDGLENRDGSDASTKLDIDLAQQAAQRNEIGPTQPQVHVNAHTRVMPMFVTDSIEAALRSESRDKIRDIAARVAGGNENFGADASLARRLEELASSLGRDYNTTFQVFRDSDNSILVKAGSLQSSGMGRSLPGRTFPVTVLVLVPERLFGYCASDVSPRIDIVAALTLRNPRTGEVIPTPSVQARLGALSSSKLSKLNYLSDNPAALEVDFREHFHSQFFKPDPKDSEWRKTSSDVLSADGARLLLALDRNDYATYRRILSSSYPDFAAFPNHVWPLLVEAINESGFSATSVSLSCNKVARSNLYREPFSSGALLLDDGKVAQVELTGFSNLPAPGRLMAYLTAERNGQPIAVPAARINIGESGTALTVQFPTLKGTRTIPTHLTVDWLGFNRSRERRQPNEGPLSQTIALQYVLVAPANKDPALLIESGKDTIVADAAGRAVSHPFVLKPTPGLSLPEGVKQIVVKFENGLVVAPVAGATWTVSPDRTSIIIAAPTAPADNFPGDITLQVSFDGLTRGQVLRATVLFDKKPAGSEIELRIVKP